MNAIKPLLRIGGLIPLSTLDYPGLLTAVVFCQGCPWRCSYCHNPDLLPVRGINEIDWDDVLKFLAKRRGLLDAVTFSGGEPTLQDNLGLAMQQVAAMGYKIGLHTNGYATDRLVSILPFVNWIGIDIKALLMDYPILTGVAGSGPAAWESVRLVIASKIDYQIRITVHSDLLSPVALQNILHNLKRLEARNMVVQPCRTNIVLDPALQGTVVSMVQYQELLSMVN